MPRGLHFDVEGVRTGPGLEPHYTRLTVGVVLPHSGAVGVGGVEVVDVVVVADVVADVVAAAAPVVVAADGSGLLEVDQGSHRDAEEQQADSAKVESGIPGGIDRGAQFGKQVREVDTARWQEGILGVVVDDPWVLCKLDQVPGVPKHLAGLGGL